MPSWLNWITNNIQVVFLVLFFVLPVLGKVLGHMQKAAQERQRKIQREREELDRLRTGRVEAPAPMAETAKRPVAIGPVNPTATQPMPQTVQQKQRAARAQQSSAQQRPAQQRPGQQRPQQQTRLVRLPGGIVLEVPVEVPETPRPQPAPQSSTGGSTGGSTQAGRGAGQRSRGEQRGQRARNVPTPQPAPAREVPAAGPVQVDEAAVRQSPSQTAMSAPAYAIRTPGVRRPAFLPKGRTEMRRAIVLSELLSPPMALREGGGGVGEEQRRAV